MEGNCTVGSWRSKGWYHSEKDKSLYHDEHIRRLVLGRRTHCQDVQGHIKDSTVVGQQDQNSEWLVKLTLTVQEIARTKTESAEFDPSQFSADLQGATMSYKYRGRDINALNQPKHLAQLPSRPLKISCMCPYMERCHLWHKVLEVETKIFANVEEWDQARHRHCDEPESFFCNQQAYGQHCEGRDVGLVSEYVEALAVHSWAKFVHGRLVPFTECYNWFMATDKITKKVVFSQIGSLTAYLLMCDYVYAGVVQAPSDEELGKLLA
ncbi:hypothetical protein DXG01_006412 [Tephrocybe rancida]|nr:hypothetical protein DXG01_006412 [Tephrocybe rancida]